MAATTFISDVTLISTVKVFHAIDNNLLKLDRLLVGSPRDGKTNLGGDKQGMIYKCRLRNRLPLDQVCTSFIGNNNSREGVRELQKFREMS